MNYNIIIIWMVEIKPVYTITVWFSVWQQLHFIIDIGIALQVGTGRILWKPIL